MLWPLLALTVSIAPSTFSIVPRILTGGLAGAWATASVATAASNRPAMARIMENPPGWLNWRKSASGERPAGSVYSSGGTMNGMQWIAGTVLGLFLTCAQA